MAFIFTFAAILIFPKSKVKALLIIAFLVILPLGIGYGIYINMGGNTSSWSNTSSWIDIRYDYYHSRPIDLIDDLHLNESTAANFTDTTITLKIKETTSNRTIWYRYEIVNHTANLSRPFEGMEIKEPKINFTYHFSFQYILNTTDSIVRKLNILGSNNTLNLSATYNPWGKINTVLDNEYSPFSNIVDIDHNGNAFIWVIDSPNRYTIKGHVFSIIAKGVTD